MRTVDLLDKIPVATRSFCLALLYFELSDNYTGVHIFKNSSTFSCKIIACCYYKLYLNKDPNKCLNIKIKFKKVYLHYPHS